MTNSIDLKACLKNLIGWKEHFNNEITIPEKLKESETGEYYQDFHPALQLNIISQTIDRERDLGEYLEEKVETGITQLINDIDSKRQSKGVKDLLASETILNKYGWANDTIFNESRFVGFLFEPTEATSLAVVIASLGLQVSIAQDELNIYVYHSSNLEPLAVNTVKIEKAISWNWIDKEIELYSRNKEVQGGTYFIGYYQEDLLGQAINYTDFDWNKGHCGTCDGGKMRGVWNNIKKYTKFIPIYVPAPSLNEERLMFSENDVMIDPNKSWGMNFRISVNCDYTDLYCMNRKNLKNALGLKVTNLILQDIKFSQQFNYINEDMKSLIIRDLEGDKDTHETGINLKLKKEIENVYLDTSGLNKYCLPCSQTGGVDYGIA